MSSSVDSTTTPRDRWFVGTYLRILAGSADTGGQLTVMEQRARRGFSPPLHVHHREDTAMLVVDGEVTFHIGGATTTVGPSSFVWLPRDVPHTFRVDSETAHMFELATPAGIEGFHIETSDPARCAELPPPTEPDVPRLVGAISRYGAEIIGPPLDPA